MITVKDLRKNYDDVEALKGITFTIEAGEIIGLLGPNGAGKTTLMKVLTGYLHPTAGQAVIGGFDVLAEADRVQEMIGYLPENAPLYPELTVQSHLKMMADLRAIPEAEQARCISDAVYATGLEDRLTRQVGTLSKGYRQRVGLAQAILHKPKLLILDEPTNGLDPRQIIEVRGLIKKLAERSTIIVSSHILSEVEATCDRVLIIIDGELKKDARLADLAKSATIELILGGEADADAVTGALRTLPAIGALSHAAGNDGRIRFTVKGDAPDLAPRIFALARDNGWPVHELKRQVRTLESVFNEVTAGGLQ
ncbi:MAG: ATP-binding cassette domain-containing protein [Thermodesulfobacteriota bacterium]